MKILYGVQGTGNGHVSRSTHIIDALQKRGMTVNVIFSGCGADKVYDPAIIRSPRFYKGFTFCVRRGRIHPADTVRQLSFFRFLKDVQDFEADDYDLIITDFEPVSAWIARKNHRPCIGIGHQYAFLHDIPMDRSNPLSKYIFQWFAPVDVAIGMHWHHFDQPILPPVIPTQVVPSDTVDPSLILVYLPFENKDQVRDLLLAFTDFQFAVYAQHSGATPVRENNIHWHPFSRTDFYRDLGRCAGVITNAGFELPSEALALGKKILVKPLKGQFEQESNAMALQILNLGMAMPSLDRDRIHGWLIRDGAPKRYYPNVADHIAQWIMTGHFDSTARLVKKTWDCAQDSGRHHS